jgi:hypothetical protein
MSRSNPTSNSAKQVSDRWTPAIINAGGFTPVSVFFLENYAALPKPLTHAEAMFVIQLMRHKFDNEAPFPGFPTLAKRMGVTPAAARGYARSLETKGYLRRQQRVARSNKFHLEALFAALETMIAKIPEEDLPF